MDYKILRRELLQIIRGDRSQTFINRRLGFKFNQVYRWESGYTAISWTDFLKVTSICHVDIESTLKKILLYQDKPERYDLLIKHVIGESSVTRIAAILGKSRFTIARWLKAESEPTLQDMLSLFHLQALVLGEFLEFIAPIDRFSKLDSQVKRPLLQRQLFYSEPRVGAVIRCFELKNYLELPKHQEGFIAQKLGIDINDEREMIRKMRNAGVIKKLKGKYRVQIRRIDTMGDFIRNTNLKKYWAQVGCNYLEKLKAPPKDSLFGYHVFSASPQTCRKIQKAMMDFHAQVKALIGSDNQAAEELLVMNFQVFNPSGALLSSKPNGDRAKLTSFKTDSLK